MTAALSETVAVSETKSQLTNHLNSEQLATGKFTEDSAVKSGLAKVLVVEDEAPAVLRSNDNQTNHLRQDVKGQYIEAKIEANTASQSGSGSTSSQQGSQQDVASNAQGQSAQTTLAATASETTQSYSQVSQGVLDTSSAKTVTVQHPAAPFPGSNVSDEAIIQQVTQKFNLHVRNQDTQINIRLQPAELGELKIDLTYREGAIRANVFAQSQHAHEVLEKNMPRLKEILQGQGIQVEDIQVSSKADITEDLDLLNDQLGKRDNYQQPSHNHIDQENFNEILDSVGVQPQNESTGVNLTV